MTVRAVRDLVLGLTLCLAPVAASAQTAGILEPTSMGPPVTSTVTKGASWRVFGVEVDPSRPVGIAAVEEVRQRNPPSHYAVSATNRSGAQIDAYVVAAAIVTADGSVRAIQELPTVKNLKPGQTRRQQTPIRIAILSESERVAFVPLRIVIGGETWTVGDADLRAAVKQTARALPIP